MLWEAILRGVPGLFHQDVLWIQLGEAFPFPPLLWLVWICSRPAPVTGSDRSHQLLYQAAAPLTPLILYFPAYFDGDIYLDKGATKAWPEEKVIKSGVKLPLLSTSFLFLGSSSVALMTP